MGGRAATLELVAALQPTPETPVLDIGAGIGGTARHLPPPLGLHLLMGETAPAKLANVMAGLEAGIFAPVELLARRL